MRRALTLLLVGGLLAVPSAPPAAAGLSDKLSAYRGLGTWVDIFDDPEWRRPVAAVNRMAELGIRTLYVETANYRQTKAIVYAKKTAKMIETAHDLGIEVVAWYLPGFQNLTLDRKRSMAAIRFTTPRGDRFDSFALDIEDSTVEPATKRTKRLLKLSRQIRRAVGAAYPLGAIIPAPRGMQLKRDYWPGFPFKGLAKIYDVFLPMGYWSYRSEGGYEFSRDYARRNVRIIRNRTGRAAVPIHPIGGVSEDVTRAEVRGFVRGAREHGVIGASLYDFGTTTDGQWSEMRRVPTNPYQPTPLPVKPQHAGVLGNVPGSDRTHPKDVVIAFGGRSGSWRLDLEAFDVQEMEVRVLVNWKRVGVLDATPAGAWGQPQSVAIADALLRDDGRNVIVLEATGDHPDWSEWGVRSIALAQA